MGFPMKTALYENNELVTILEFTVEPYVASEVEYKGKMYHMHVHRHAMDPKIPKTKQGYEDGIWVGVYSTKEAWSTFLKEELDGIMKQLKGEFLFHRQRVDGTRIEFVDN